MNLTEWECLSPEQQEAEVQQLNPFEEWDLFKAVEAEFTARYGSQPRMERIFCGIPTRAFPPRSGGS